MMQNIGKKIVVRNTEAAFRWIVGLLTKHNIPFQIAGGFAARAYGAERELYDIDFDIPEADVEKILPEIKPYLVYGPTQYKDDHWNLLLLTLSYEGQRIDISSAHDAKKFDAAAQAWVSARVDLDTFQMMEVYGIMVPLIPKATLIEYKKKLGRDVDREDVKALAG